METIAKWKSILIFHKVLRHKIRQARVRLVRKNSSTKDQMVGKVKTEVRIPWPKVAKLSHHVAILTKEIPTSIH